MKKGFTKIIIGQLFLFLNIHFFIDWLPDPIGFFLIHSGIKELSKRWNLGSNAIIVKNLAITFAFLSIPSVFISRTTDQEIFHMFLFTQVYLIIMNIAFLIFIFYLFHFLFDIAKRAEEQNLLKNSIRLFYLSFIVWLIIGTTQSFVWNIQEGWLVMTLSILYMVNIVLQILFILLLFSYRKTPDGWLEAKM
ncbi:hypothetical protein [Fervidibacillus halotolerans]|uniref:Uncharacterized protein n=1 Tax=Fervidibacillus halotolerans TaxID=2980027 RepID=A0A9E8S152_9BACI|nr:hypothetical protein [Fervidibacillus halotolerans]WAA13172.1 hypothetical protein OE105_03315 [Fervidibacillus halotolerans]